MAQVPGSNADLLLRRWRVAKRPPSMGVSPARLPSQLAANTGKAGWTAYSQERPPGRLER